MLAGVSCGGRSDLGIRQFARRRAATGSKFRRSRVSVVVIGIGIFGMLRQTREQQFSSIVGAQYLLESTKFLRDLVGGLVALLGNHLPGWGRERQGRAVAEDRSDQTP